MICRYSKPAEHHLKVISFTFHLHTKLHGNTALYFRRVFLERKELSNQIQVPLSSSLHFTLSLCTKTMRQIRFKNSASSNPCILYSITITVLHSSNRTQTAINPDQFIQQSEAYSTFKAFKFGKIRPMLVV